MESDGRRDYFSGEYLQDILEFQLAEIGGEALVQVAQVEAAGHVQATCPPWDGTGDEPAERVSAFCAGLWRVIERHHTPG